MRKKVVIDRKVGFLMLGLALLGVVLTGSTLATDKIFRPSENVAADSIYLEVESGNVEHPMLIKSDILALGSEFVEVESGNQSSSEPPNEGKVTMEVNLSGGTYTIWGRTSIQDEDSDSFWVQVNDGEAYNWNGIPITPFWGWSQVEDFRYREVVEWSLPAGTHTITIYYREPKARIDALFITNTGAIPTQGDDLFPPNLANIRNPPIPWMAEYNFSLPDFQFEHPMTVINQDELNMVKHYIDHQVEPQYSAYLQLIEEADDEQSFVPDAPASMNIMGGYEPNSNLGDVRDQLWRNCHAAYSSALAYQLTGESRYADKAVEVMMDWANANTTFTGGDRGLQLGSWFSQVLYAADLIHEYEGWTEAQRATFKSWWRNNVLVHTLDVLRRKDNNWKDAALLGVFTASVVLEDTVLLKEAIIQLKSYFYERTDENVRNPGVDWKMRLDEHGVYLPREVVRNAGSSGLTYTAYAMTSMVQCLDIAKYAGFDLWHNSTTQGADITQLMESYFEWDIQDRFFPWNNDPKKSNKRRNAYELANRNLELSSEVVSWIESNRPQVAREGDEYATLTKGDLHISKLTTETTLEDNDPYAPGDTIRFSIQVQDPYQIGLDQVQIRFNGEIHSSYEEFSIDTLLVMPDNETPDHKIEIITTDDFGVTMEKEYTVLNSDRAKSLNLDYESAFGSISVVPDQDFFTPGQEVTLTVAAKFPYVFNTWSGDLTSTDAEIQVVMDDDFSLEAGFQIREDPRINFNFQPQGRQIPSGYRSETGDAFRLSDEVQYGWIGDESLFGIGRNSPDVWDPRKLSYIQMQQGTAQGSRWEIELASGPYNIEIGFGDPTIVNHVNTFYLEGQLVSDPDGKDSFDVFSFENFEVSDGFLTINPAGENVKINYIKIAPASTPLHRFLTVNEGTGEGEYPVGAQVDIAADAPTGTDLFEWIGDSAFVDDVSSNETFLLMPDQDVILGANYIPTYALIVESGSGSGNYREGVTVEVSASSVEGSVFVGWTGDTQFLADETSPNTTLTMANQTISIQAAYESVLGFDLNATRFNLYPNPTAQEATLAFILEFPVDLTVEVLDLSGKYNVRYNKAFSAGQHQITLQDGLISGVNVVRVQSNDQILTYLLVKQ